MSEKQMFTDEELIHRVWDVEEIKKVVHKRGYYISNEWRRQEIDDLWVSGEDVRRTASFGSNIGWYVGMDEIVEYYVHKHAADRRAQLALISDANPDIENSEKNLHIGCLSHHPVTTGVVQLAGDGKTAKALFYSIAQKTEALPDGSARVLWVPEKQAYDFFKENGEWKIWHIVIATDLTCEAGESFAMKSPFADYENDPVMLEFGTPTKPCLCHDSTFNWWDNYPSAPEPYQTFTDDISYGPEGYHLPECFHFGAGEGRNYK